MILEQSTIREAIKLLHEAAPDAKIILFGSYATGQQTSDSDIDFLVIEPQLNSQVQEMVRLRRILSPLRIPVDVIVASKEDFDYWCDTPGNIFYDAANNGKVLYEAA